MCESLVVHLLLHLQLHVWLCHGYWRRHNTDFIKWHKWGCITGISLLRLLLISLCVVDLHLVSNQCPILLFLSTFPYHSDHADYYNRSCENSKCNPDPCEIASLTKAIMVSLLDADSVVLVLTAARLAVKISVADHA